MSSVFRISKSKVSQEELRRLMRIKQQEQQKQETRIDSPLAKYEGSQLTCAICRAPVAPKAWRAHLNSRKHTDQVEAARVLRQRSLQPKRPATPPPLPPAKKIRGILKNAPTPVHPAEAEDDTSVEPQFEQTAKNPINVVAQTENDPNRGNNSVKPNEAESDEALPEGFFDDPIMDAKARNIQYKDPIEEEWEKFQKEMKEQTNLSAAIIAGEQEEATAERQIDEIEEQMRNLSKVLDLNRKKEEAAKQKALEIAASMEQKADSSEDEEEFDEYLDWRAKKSFR